MHRVSAILTTTANSLGLDYPHTAITYCVEYIFSLCKWNKYINLVGKHTPYDIAQDLCLDSIYLAYVLQSLSFPIQHIVDCGAGAGIPGIPLRCFYFDGMYTMVESRQKRVLFIESILRQLSLPKTTCQSGRVEKICTMIDFDALISRAFMSPEKLLPFAQQFLVQGQYLIMMLNTIPTVIRGYKLVYSYTYLVCNRVRYICILQKI